MDEAITKRVHISGLTPAITAKDLSDRLSSFGTVKSIDGFGLLDAVGQPRKFAYVTLETTKGKLARCMNLLSGVTWKGAKLRLGEAKPDYRERIQKEHDELKRAAEASADEPAHKRRRLPRSVQGVHARDMSLVTPENVSTRGGWRVTPTGRLIRPMRMRPAHPLPEPLDTAKPSKKETKSGARVKTRTREPPSRARRKTIDPTKWGSQHLKGIFLENAAVTYPAPSRHEPIAAPVDDESSEGSQNSESESDSEHSSEESDKERSPSLPPPVPTTIKAAPARPATATKSVPQSSIDSELAEEKNQTLGLLQSLFGDKEEWGGAESVGSDVEEEVGRDHGHRNISAADGVDDVQDSMDVDEQQPDLEPSPPPITQGTVSAPEGTKAKLKDLFAPREEDAGFSLLGHLDLDLELDDDVPFDVPAPAAASAPLRPTAPVQPSTSSRIPHVVLLDHSRPLFFPSDQSGGRRRVLDPTDWKTWFYRTDSPEAIRTRWEETKGELTAGWKRRHREAIKSRRRRGGAAE
ncbi:hypothetical protein K466DRAFT_600266 [Polyporus arcularius HHB13444]|uniref:RRM domain-containing protein n=1 Tax=Polyporus arcularius HHB13444 TaxID=1314778 RepID=A0A5C3PBA8_9APHY|nr:hypothetical protein K466DRAFT_600266 [Polyporus arcularius HHB13444]